MSHYSFYLLYDFSANAGDTLEVVNPAHIVEGEKITTTKLKVDSIFNVSLDGLRSKARKYPSLTMKEMFVISMKSTWKGSVICII